MSEKCRLCLKIIPIESVIKLYYFLHQTTEAAEMVKLIAQYLHIEVTKNDIVSTIICQDCNDHLEDFHKFSEDVAAKQLTLQNDLLETGLKKEYPLYDDDNADENINSTCLLEEELVENKISTAEQAILECPIDVVKDELDSDREVDDLCVQDMLETDLNEDDTEDYKLPDDIQSSDDDIPLIKLKARKCKIKKSTSTNATKNKKKRDRRQSTLKKSKKPKPKKERQRRTKLSGQQLIADSLELKCDICQTQVPTWRELRQHFLLAHTRTPYIKCCNIVYEKQRPLVEHLQWHKNPDAFKCLLCDENLKNSRDLTTHISTVHPENIDLLEQYECEHCFKQFRSYTIYKNHLRTHNKDRDVECHICNKRYETKHKLERHIKIQHKDKSPLYVCDVCGKHLKNKASFKRHYEEQHLDNTGPAVQCTICKTWLKSRHSLRIHRFLHEEKPQTCEICSKVFKSRRSLKRHIKNLHEIQTSFSCSFCEKTFRDERNLHEHMAIHTGVQLYNCPHCYKESRSKSNMYVHIKRQHPDEWWKSRIERLNLDPNTVNPEVTHHQLKLQYPPPPNKSLDESIENSGIHIQSHLFFTGFPPRYETKHKLERHIKIQHKDKSPLYVCDVCGKHLKNKASFKRHYEEQHLDNTGPAVQCTICKTWLKSRHSLRIHRFLHEEKPQTCEICSKVFKSRRSLKRHIKNLHEIQTSFSCSFCEKTFRDERNLHEHMAIHTGVQLYNCPHCYKESRSKSNMYVHIKRQHPDEWWKSRIERLNLDPNTVNPEVTHHQLKLQYPPPPNKSLDESIENSGIHIQSHLFFTGFPPRY